MAWAAWHLPLFLNAATTQGAWPLSQQLIWIVSIMSGAVIWTWMYNSTGSVLAVAIVHAGLNGVAIFHPADTAALAPGGVPDTALNLLAEVTGAVPLLLFALLLIVIYGGDRLSNREIPGPEVVGLD